MEGYEYNKRALYYTGLKLSRLERVSRSENATSVINAGKMGGGRGERQGKSLECVSIISSSVFATRLQRMQ